MIKQKRKVLVGVGDIVIYTGGPKGKNGVLITAVNTDNYGDGRPTFHGVYMGSAGGFWDLNPKHIRKQVGNKTFLIHGFRND